MDRDIFEMYRGSDDFGRGTNNFSWSTADLRRGIVNFGWGIVNVRKGTNNFRWGTDDLRWGTNNLRWGTVLDRGQIHRTAFRCAWISGSTSSATAAANCS